MPVQAARVSAPASHCQFGDATCSEDRSKPASLNSALPIHLRRLRRCLLDLRWDGFERREKPAAVERDLHHAGQRRCRIVSRDDARRQQVVMKDPACQRLLATAVPEDKR